MTVTTEQLAKLHEAARLVRSVANRLNTDAEVCDHCGTNVYDDFDEYKANVELTAAANKIKRWANVLAQPGGEEEE